MKFFIFSLFCFFMPITASSQTFATINGIKYELDANKKEAYVALNGGSNSTVSGNITIPAKVTYQSRTYNVVGINALAFVHCGSLKNVTISSGIKSIGTRLGSDTDLDPDNDAWGAFEECTLLESVTIPSTVQEIGERAFYNCRKLASVNIPNGISEINPETFYGCSSLTTISIPNTVTEIYSSAFQNCRSLASITIPDGVTKLYGYTFCDCKSLTSITIHNGMELGGSGNFMGCSSVETLTIGSGVTFGYTGQFSGLTNLKTLSIDSDINMDQHWNQHLNCYGSPNLQTLIIGENCNTILGAAFKDYTALENVTICKGDKNIDTNAFSGCTNIKTLNLDCKNVKAWFSASKTKVESLTLGENVETIANSAFSGFSKLTELNIPNNVTSIGNYAFQNCSGITSLTLSNSLTSIPLYVFYGCSGITEVAIPSGVSTIGISAFYGCSGLETLTIPNSVTSIGDSAFEGCSSLENLTIPNNVTTIGSYAFSECYGLTQVTIPSSVTSIGSGAFSCGNLAAINVESNNSNYDSRGNCNAIINKSNNTLIAGCKNTNIPNSVTSIGNYAFYHCNLTSINIPNSVTSIGSRAFKACGSLASVTIPSSVTSIGSQAFYDCKELAAIIIPESVTTIDSETFYKCTNLTSVTIPSSVTKILSSAFEYCTNLPSITLPKNLSSLGNRAFYNCNSLNTVTAEMDTPISIQTNTFMKYETLIVPVGSLSQYNDADVWKNFKVIKGFGRLEQTMEMTSIPTLTYGDAAYTLPQTTTEGLILTWSVANTSIATVSSNVLTIKAVGTTTVTATQPGNDEYEPFSKEFSLTVNPKNASNLTISSIAAVTYNGSVQTPTVTVKDGSTTLTNGTHYTVSYSNNTNAGTATVTVTGMGNYTGTKKAYFTINAKDASNLTINSISAVTYNGSAQTPAITVKDGNITLTSGTHYTVSYSNNINAGAATVTVTGKGNYTGTKTANFTINAKNASNLTISSIAAVTYNGSAQTPTVMVKDGSTTLTNGTHYTAAYSNNINAGTATVTITGRGNYTGTKTANFTINSKSASSLTISSIVAVTYNGSAQTPAVTVKDGSTTLTNGTHYTVAYSNNINAGTATVTITGKGNYTGTKTANFTINKAALTITANDYSINQRDEFPTFEATYSGFVNGETESVMTTLPSFTCSAADTETPGSYTITPSGATAQNYDISYVLGTLTINPVEYVHIVMKNDSGVGRTMIGYSSKYGLDFTNVTDVKAYIVMGYMKNMSDVLSVRVNIVPPYTGIVIKTDNPGVEVDVPVSVEEYYYGNLLKPVVESQTINPTETNANGDDFTNFIVGKLTNGDMGFVRVKTPVVRQNKCYLPVLSSFYNSSASARQSDDFGIVFVEGESNDVRGLLYDGSPSNGDYYDLLGRRVKPVGKGLYIHNGKKVFVK